MKRTWFAGCLLAAVLVGTAVFLPRLSAQDGQPAPLTDSVVKAANDHLERYAKEKAPAAGRSVSKDRRAAPGTASAQEAGSPSAPLATPPVLISGVRVKP